MTTSTMIPQMYSVDQIQEIIFKGEIAQLSDAIISLLKHVESQLEIVEYPTAATTGPGGGGGGEYTSSRSSSSTSKFGHNTGARDSHNHNSSNAGTGGGGYRNKFDISGHSSRPDARHQKHEKDNRRNGGDKSGSSRLGGNGNSNSSGKREITDNDWETMRDFKTTKIETKTGVDKQVNDLRVLLNKISTATYDKQRDAIIAAFRDYFASGEESVSEDNTAKLSKAVFDIASTNKFYSELYANLFKELVSEFDVFKIMLARFVENFCATSTQSIVYIDPDQDYDGYCVYVKQSEIRKSTATFIVCCLMRELVELGDVIDIVIEFIDSVMRLKDEQGKTKEVEEITELIFIMVCALNEKAKAMTKWEEQVMQEVERLSKMKAKDYASLSNRAVFKFMDLMDKL